MEASCTSHMGPLKPILRTGCRACCLSPGCCPVALTFVRGALPGRRGECSQLGITPTRLQASGLAAPGHAAWSDRSGFTWSVAGRGIRRPWEGCCFKEVSLSSSGRSPRLFPGQAGSPHTKPDTPTPNLQADTGLCTALLLGATPTGGSEAGCRPRMGKEPEQSSGAQVRGGMAVSGTATAWSLHSYRSAFSSRIIMSTRKNAFGSFLLRNSVLLQGLGVGSSAL